MNDLEKAIEDMKSKTTDCPVSAFQASKILLTLENIATEQKKMDIRIKSLTDSVDDLLLDKAVQSGFKKGANFWFKVGVITTVATIGGGILAFIGLITGKLDIWAMLKT